MTYHTPEPWTVEKTKRGSQTHPWAIMLDGADIGRAVDEKTARQMAATPDLVAALGAVDRLITKHGIGDDDAESEPVVNQIRAALAKVPKE